MTFFHASVASCSSSLTIKAGLATSGTYNCVVTDKFNNHYNPSITIDSYGSVLLDLAQFPDGLFTPYSGAFQLMLYNVSDNSPVSMTLCGITYNGFFITFYNGESPLASTIEC